MGLWALLREDWETHDRCWSKPGLHVVAVHRIGTRIQALPMAARIPLRVLHRALRSVIVTAYSTDIAENAVLGRRVKIGHHQGLVVEPDSVIGTDVLLRQYVTIGATTGESPSGDPTRIGNHVLISPGAIVVRGVRVGDDARIGLRAIVTTDMQSGTTAFPTPARVRRAETPDPHTMIDISEER